MWKRAVLTVTFLLFLVLFSQIAYAVETPDLGAQVMGQLGGTATKAEAASAVDPRFAVAGMIRIFLSLVGTIFLILIIMSGYWLITARGEEDKEEKARNTIRSAVIGLAIVIAAYGITTFVTERVQRAATPPPPAQRRR